MGKVPGLKQEDTSANLVTSLLIKNNSIADLWKMEILGIMDLVETKSKEMEKNAVKHFMKTVDRDEKGRYWFPRRPQSPRLELLACCIGARLTSSIRKAMNLEDIPSLAGWKLGNISQELVTLLISHQWLLCPGISEIKMVGGFTVVKTSEEDWPVTVSQCNLEEILKERKKAIVLLITL
ncbi:hypothetical protein TNIN_11801 [Trichonephila inaurata madagascariensis]|uniref:Uncharacterized protein n=1 Tax=Trichonephila inaurata madagascariensis TaxID=2747483 RepID=A0A8X6WRM3_9ARAC|nr:hypothetical protein TNIN_11801 [Trichonephila inaurata madagascariensis]